MSKLNCIKYVNCMINFDVQRSGTSPAKSAIFRLSQREAEAIYENVLTRYKAKSREKLDSASTDRKWRSSLKESVPGLAQLFLHCSLMVMLLCLTQRLLQFFRATFWI